MFGSMLMTRSWIDRRMLASPGVDLRRDDVSSETHVSSLGFFSADGVPIHPTSCIAPSTEEDREGTKWERRGARNSRSDR
jgi:hypothetical protein